MGYIPPRCRSFSTTPHKRLRIASNKFGLTKDQIGLWEFGAFDGLLRAKEICSLRVGSHHWLAYLVDIIMQVGLETLGNGEKSSRSVHFSLPHLPPSPRSTHTPFGKNTLQRNIGTSGRVKEGASSFSSPFPILLSTRYAPSNLFSSVCKSRYIFATIGAICEEVVNLVEWRLYYFSIFLVTLKNANYGKDVRGVRERERIKKTGQVGAHKRSHSIMMPVKQSDNPGYLYYGWWEWIGNMGCS